MEQKPKYIVNRKVYDLTHAKHSPIHCLTPGLFQSVKPNERKRTVLDVTYKYADKTVNFFGREILDANDMRLVQILVAMGTQKPTISKPQIKSAQPNLFPASVINDKTTITNAIIEGQKKDVTVIKTSIRNLLIEMNLTDGGDNINTIRTRLLRLSSISIWIDDKEKLSTYYLLNFTLDKKSEVLHIELNNMITDSIMKNTNFTVIEVDEIRQLKTAPARLIHQRLCGWINSGKVGSIGINTLCEYVWTTPAPTANAFTQRKKTIKKALTELENLGWKIYEVEKDEYTIHRINYFPI